MNYYTFLDSPVDPLFLASDGTALTELFMARNAKEIPPGYQRADDLPVLSEAKRQLSEYFDGSRTSFDLALAPRGTEFQRRVWRELTEIPYGQTISYGQLAERIGNPAASRAVGLANGRNPLSIVVPCHRVIGANGKLVGYGGGLPRKQILLQLEQGGGLFG